MKIFVENKKTDITDLLYNTEHCDSLSAFQQSDNFNCTYFDKMKNRYFRYEYYRYDKPEIITYDRDKKTNIVYFPNGDSAISKWITDNDSLMFPAFLTNIKELVYGYNSLLRNEKNTFKDWYRISNVIKSGIEKEVYCFWIPDRMIQQIKDGDFISVEIKLFNGKIFNDQIKFISTQ